MNPHVARLEGVDEKDRRVTAGNEVEAAVLRGVQRREGWKPMEKEGFILRRYFRVLTKDNELYAVLWRKEG